MINIPRNIYNSMVNQALACRPHEACGLLVGQHPNVVSYTPMTNVAPEHHYEMKPEEIKEFFEKEKDFCGIFHSHVSIDAYPSKVDIESAYYPGVSYLILSLQDPMQPVLKSYRLVSKGIFSGEVVNIED